MKKKIIICGLIGIFFTTGKVFAEDSTKLDTEIVQFINSVPAKLSGQVLIDIAKSLHRDKYIAEAVLCYQKGIERRVFNAKPDLKEKVKNYELRRWYESDFFQSSPKWAKYYILQYIIANSTDDIKESAQKRLNAMIEYQKQLNKSLPND